MIPDEVLNPSGTIERFGTVEVGDGRTIVARIAPFGVDARVRDGENGPEYVERIARGAFRRALRDPARVPILLNYEHREGLGDQIGRATELVERDDGLHGTFVALSTPFGDQGLDLIRGRRRSLPPGVSTSGRIPFRRRSRRPPSSESPSRRPHRVARVRRHAEVLAVRSYLDDEDVAPVRAVATLDYVERMRARFPVAP